MHSDSDDTETEFLLALNGPTAVDRRRCLAWWVSFSNISVRSREKLLFGDALIDATKNLSTCSRPFKNFSRWHYSAQDCFWLFCWFIALFVSYSTLWLIFVLEQLHHNFSRWIKDLCTVLSRSEWKRSSINLRCACSPSDKGLRPSQWYQRAIKTTSISRRLTSVRNLIVQFKEI